MKQVSHLILTTLSGLSLTLFLLAAPASAQSDRTTDETGASVHQIDPSKAQSGGATDRTGSKIQLGDASEDTPPVSHHESVAVLPWCFVGGTEGAKRTAREFLNAVLAKGYLEILPESRVAASCEDLDIDTSERGKVLPSPRQLLKLGMKLGVDYVIAPLADWHSRPIWVSLGPKTKSTCSVDMLIIDVKNQEVVLDAKQVRMDDTAKESTLQTLGSLFISMYITVLSGGPKTPHEQRAGQLAVAKAIEPWIETRLRKVKISTSN